MHYTGALAVDSLLSGPRGRRMLVEFALKSEGRLGHHIGDETEEVAQYLAAVQLAEATPMRLRAALTQAVFMATYWQEPDGTDILIASSSVRNALRRVAGHIAASPHAQWWTTGVAMDDQWSVTWHDNLPDLKKRVTSVNLDVWRDETLQDEGKAHRERPRNPKANLSAEWWPSPPAGLTKSTRSLVNGSPAGLWFVEDSMGWKRATTRRLQVADAGAVFEIEHAGAWAELCRRYPLEVTAQKRHDWYRTTGRNGRWIIPDWSLVAADYAGVHLTVAGYLSAAGNAITVDGDLASVIAGWNADETWWFTDSVRPVDAPTIWTLNVDAEGVHWVRETTP